MADPSKRALGSATSDLTIDDFICFAVYSAGHAFNRIYKPLLDPLGLTYPQYLVMVALWAADKQTVGALGEKLLLESSTLTPLLKRLEAMGLVQRKRDAEDERVVRVSLTEKGKALQRNARQVPDCVSQMTGLSPTELRRLTATITKLRETLREAEPGSRACAQA